jgi:hypothetical protein
MTAELVENSTVVEVLQPDGDYQVYLTWPESRDH